MPRCAGYRAGGVAATAKHFPGLGAAALNTDDGPVTIDAAARRAARSASWSRSAAAVDAHVPLVMLSHALYPALDARRIASQSPAVATGLLRRRLGFHGVTVTDSLEAAAVLARSDVAAAAGALGPRRCGPDPDDRVRELERGVPAAARAGAPLARLPRPACASRAARVLALKRAAGLR